MAVCREDAGGAGGDARRAGDALCGPHLRQRGAIAAIAVLLLLYCGTIAALLQRCYSLFAVLLQLYCSAIA